VLQAGVGRIGTLPEPSTVTGLAARVAEVFAIDSCTWSGESDRMVQRVGVLPGSGRSLIETAAGSCEVLITGDLGYHDAERARELDLSLVTVPHGDVEWWALRRWVDTTLRRQVERNGVTVSISRAWRSPWTGPPRSDSADDQSARQSTSPSSGTPAAFPHGPLLRLRIDGGSRGNPGPSAIGVVLEDDSGRVLDTVSQAIGIATNNVAEYRALLTGLELAERGRAREVEVLSDSELLVRQMRGEYRVKNEGLKPLHEEATQRLRAFERAVFRHVPREDNKLADELVNRALDSAPG
jgi:ribonuclease HI